MKRVLTPTYICTNWTNRCSSDYFYRRFIANVVELNGHGISKNLGLPKMTINEMTLANLALSELDARLEYVLDWYCKYSSSTVRLDSCASQSLFFNPSMSTRFEDCAYAGL